MEQGLKTYGFLLPWGEVFSCDAPNIYEACCRLNEHLPDDLPDDYRIDYEAECEGEFIDLNEVPNNPISEYLP